MARVGRGSGGHAELVDPSYGKLGLDLIRAGKSAPDALRTLLTGDAACEVRQVALLDANDNVATFTGTRDIIAAGGIAGNSTRRRTSPAVRGGIAVWTVVTPSP